MPSSFSQGVITPVFKKPSLDVTLPASYRPLTLASTLVKVLELVTLPKLETSDTQFGFKSNLGCDVSISTFTDVLMIARAKATPLYVCLLDAEKCFDRLWHDGIFYKLHSKLPFGVWKFQCLLYRSLNAVVKVKDSKSGPFAVTRGTRQGGCSSPLYFNVFINDLLHQLSNCDAGFRFGSIKLNNIAYADDLTLLSTTGRGLQKLLDICECYARKWRFSYNASKSQFIIFSNNKRTLNTHSSMSLGGSVIPQLQEVELLGCAFSFSHNGSASLNAQRRSEKCRKAFFKHKNQGLSFPRLDPHCKAYIWRTACQPVLLYCLSALNYTKRDIETLNGVQTRFVKTFMGLPNNCRHSKLLTALHITSVHFVLTDTLCSLFNRILCLPSRSVATSVLMYAVQCFMGDGYVHNGTLIDRILKLQISPLRALYGPPRELAPPDGTVDSITNVLNMNLCKNSYEQQLLFLLCRF